MRRCAGKEKNHCVPKAPGAEQMSERYSDEARCVGTRCCVDPEVVSCVDQRGDSKGEKNKKTQLVSLPVTGPKNSHKVCTVYCFTLNLE